MPWAKSVVGALVLLAVPFFVAGPIAGSVCLFFAVCVALVAWTRLGGWLGFHSEPSEAIPAEGADNRSHAPTETQRAPGDTYGGAAVGAATRQSADKEEARATFVAVEAEIALAHEEAIEMAKLLRAEWPHITPEGAVVQVALPDWRTKTTDFIGVVLGSAQRAAFKGAETGSNLLERLESERSFLSDLALKVTLESIRADQAAVLEARKARRDNEAAQLFAYEHSRAPGAPSAIPASPLELWLQERLDAAEMNGRQRAVRGDEWYFGEMNKWDFTNVQRMHDGDDPLAPDLVEAYRSNPKTGRADGIHAPHDAAELGRYYKQRLTWLRETLADLRSESQPRVNGGAHNYREFPRRDDRGDLAQKCHMLAGSIERWVQSYKRQQPGTVEKMVEEGLAAEPDLDPVEARRKAYNLYDKNWQTEYAIKYRPEAKKLFYEAWEMHEIAKSLERLAVQPVPIEFEKVPKLFNDIADRLYGERLL